MMQSLKLDGFALPLEPEVFPDILARTCERAIEEQTQAREEISYRVQRVRQQAARLQDILREFLDLCGCAA
jgi:uncharacterized membrane protein YccC